jgi:cell wall-associated NlpC family hydrolase
MASQAGSYAALLAGGVLAAAGFSGRPVRDILAGKASPLKGLVSEPPPAQTLGGGGGSPTAQFASRPTGSGPGVGAVSPGAAGAVDWAKRVLGTSEGSGKVARWISNIGAAPGIPWCSAFIAAALRNAGIKNIPSDAAYSGAWLDWKGGTNLRTTSLRKAVPGDILIFDWGDGGITDHVGLYIGNGKMIAGNDSNDAVGESSVPTGNIVGIVRPKYPRTSTRRGYSGTRRRRTRRTRTRAMA